MARIQVGGHSNGIKRALRILAALAFFLGLLLTFTIEFGFLVMAIIGALVWIPLEIDAAITRGRRRWIEDLGDGFRFIDSRGERDLRDEDVTDVAIEERIDHSSMNDVKAFTKTRLWVQGDHAPLVLETTRSQATDDETAPLVARLIHGLIDRTHAKLLRGGALRGERWTLTRSYLEIGLPGQEERFDLQQVEAIDTFDNQVCVWRRGSDFASAKIPAISRNACLLGPLTARLMPQRNEQDDRMPTSGLGRILFERKQPSAALFAGAVLFGIAFAVSAFFAAQNSDLLWLPLLLGVIALLCLWGGVVNQHKRFRCHERGVYSGSLFGEQMMHYDEVAEFTFNATRQYVNGGYTGTTLSLTFEPQPGSLAKRMCYSAMVRGGDNDLDMLRDHIARVIAYRLGQQFASGQPIPWTRVLTLLPEGIEYRPSGLLGRKDPVLLPYENYAGFNLDQGVFYIFAKDQTKAVCDEKTSAPNFFPGYFLLCMLLHQPEEAPA